MHTWSTMAAWLEVISSKVSIFVFCLLDATIHVWHCYSSFSSSLNVVFSCHLYLNNGFNYFHLRNLHFPLMFLLFWVNNFLFKIYLHSILCFNNSPLKALFFNFPHLYFMQGIAFTTPKPFSLWRRRKPSYVIKKLNATKNYPSSQILTSWIMISLNFDSSNRWYFKNQLFFPKYFKLLSNLQRFYNMQL